MGESVGESAGRPVADPVREVFRRALRDVLVLTAVVTVLGTVVGGLVAGAPGAWGGVVGGAIALAAAAATPVTMLKTAGAPLMTAMLAVMGAWVVKSAVVIAAVALLRGSDWFDAPVLFWVAAAGLLGSVLVDGRAVQNGRVPYVTSEAAPRASEAPSASDSSGSAGPDES